MRDNTVKAPRISLVRAGDDNMAIYRITTTEGPAEINRDLASGAQQDSHRLVYDI